MDFNNGSKPTISYAQTLRKMGYCTAIHALPQEGQGLVNSLMERGYSNTDIVKEINGEYKQYLADRELKPISCYSVRTYKNNYWVNSPEFSKIISTGNPTIKKKLAQVKDKADQLMLKFNALEQLITVALKVKELIIDKDSQYELNNPMGFIDRNREKARWHYFLICKEILRIQLELGLIKVTHSSETKPNIPIEKKEISHETLLEQATKLYNELTSSPQ